MDFILNSPNFNSILFLNDFNHYFIFILGNVPQKQNIERELIVKLLAKYFTNVTPEMETQINNFITGILEHIKKN